MKSIGLGVLILLCFASATAHIYSSDSKVTYDFNGQPRIYHIYFSLSTGLGADDYLHIHWPEQIHSGTDKSALAVKLISFSNNLEIVETVFDDSTNAADSEYYVTFGVSMTKMKWYEIQIFPNQVPAVSYPYHGLIQLRALSSLDSTAIIYDSNMGFSYISIEDDLASTGTMTVAVTSPVGSEATRVSSIYTIYIEVTPSLPNTNGGNFTLNIHYDSGDTTHTTDSTH